MGVSRVVFYSGTSYVPIFEMHSSVHNAAAISGFLLNYRKAYEQNHTRWPPFRVVVTDYSMALIYSVLITFNKMSLERYLKETYDYVYGVELPQNIV